MSFSCLMDFSQYPDRAIVNMTVHDLPTDADVFFLRGIHEPFGNVIGASSATAQRHWEHRWEYDKYVWRTWRGTTDYYTRNGDLISRGEAASIIWRLMPTPPELQLPAGL